MPSKDIDKLWAPWRETYVTKILTKTKGCVFCQILKDKKDKRDYVFIRTKYSYAVLNIYPYNNGHVLIIPNRHVKDLGKLRKEERDDLFDLLQTSQSTLDEVLKADGYNIGINVGKAAGAGFPGHLHIHLVPRWIGDVNFMPVTGRTKIISQSLRVLHTKLSNAYKKRH